MEELQPPSCITCASKPLMSQKSKPEASSALEYSGFYLPSMTCGPCCCHRLQHTPALLKRNCVLSMPAFKSWVYVLPSSNATWKKTRAQRQSRNPKTTTGINSLHKRQTTGFFSSYSMGIASTAVLVLFITSEFCIYSSRAWLKTQSGWNGCSLTWPRLATDPLCTIFCNLCNNT